MRIIGHHEKRLILQDWSRQASLAQSYLFLGPRSVGKSLCALEFAAQLVGEADFAPTENKPVPFDVHIIRPEKETKRGVTKVKKISAEAVREATHFLVQFPLVGQYRVLIIEEAHSLSETAQNALLKTLEEPASTAILILVTHEVGRLLPTVLSRVKRVGFDFVPAKQLQQDLSELFPEYRGETLADFFFELGRPGMILQALREPELFQTEREQLGRLYRLSTLSWAERLALAEELGTHTERTVRLLEWWLPGLHRQALQVTEQRLLGRFFSLLESVEQSLLLLKTTQANARLLLEKLFLSV